jgi:hypothetical protein
MKKTKILYWIFTGLFAAFMIFTSIPEVMMSKDALTFMRGLGYPDYISPFLGVAKILGAIAIVIPGFPRLKEWAYAGLFFDLFGATYSQLAQYGWQPGITFMLLFFIFMFVSYALYHKRQQAVAATA